MLISSYFNERTTRRALSTAFGLFLALTPFIGGPAHGQECADAKSSTETTLALSCDPREAEVAAQPLNSDTVRDRVLDSEHPRYVSADGVLRVQWAGRGRLVLTHDPADPATGPRVPTDTPDGLQPGFALHQIKAANLRLIPIELPNRVDLTLNYAEHDLDQFGTSTSGVRMFYYDADLGRWVAVPTVIDPTNRTVTWMDADVSALARRLTRVALFW